MRFLPIASSLLALAISVSAMWPASNGDWKETPRRQLEARQDSTPKMVFAHFIVGIVASYTQDDWAKDIQIAQSIGVDAFALNIGTDSYTSQQLAFAYDAAAAANFKLFISFDFSWYSISDPAPVQAILANFTSMPAQLMVEGKAFVSSFVGDNFAFHDAASAAGVDIFACPFWQASSLQNMADQVDCGFQWNAWPTQNNNPIDSNYTTDIDGDAAYMQALNGKPYMAPVSPWMYTHYGPPPSYNKNWLFLSDTLYKTRWDQILQLQPQFVEIITWNDFGESHYIGPLHDDNPSLYADAAKEWVPGFTHDAWRDVTALYIQAYKAGQQTVTPTTDELIYYYRPMPKTAQCNDPVPPPNGADFVEDSVFVIAMLSQPGTVVITSGSNAPVSIQVQAGITNIGAPMGTGSQVFELQRNGASVMSGTGGMQITPGCPQSNGTGVYNFNAFVGAVTGNGSGPAPPTSAPPTSAPPPPPTSAPPPPPTSAPPTSAPPPPPTTTASPTTTIHPPPPPPTTAPTSAPTCSKKRRSKKRSIDWEALAELL